MEKTKTQGSIKLVIEYTNKLGTGEWGYFITIGADKHGPFWLGLPKDTLASVVMERTKERLESGMNSVSLPSTKEDFKS